MPSQLSHPATIAEVERRRERMKQALLTAGVDEHRIAKRISELIDSNNEQSALDAIDRSCRLLGLNDDDDSGRLTAVLGGFTAFASISLPRYYR